MAKNMEYEYKTLLSESDYLKVLHFFQKENTKKVTQTNHYFDTIDFALKKINAALRIREFDDKGEITLKIKQAKGNLEINEAIQKEEILAKRKHFALQDSSEIQKELKMFSIQDDELVNWGSLTTHRIEFQTEYGLLAIDESHYSEIIDYELELEVRDFDLGKQSFDTLLETLEIPYRRSENKVGRLNNAIFQ